MHHIQDTLRPPPALFQSQLANVLFDAPAPPERAAEEAQIVEALLERIEKMPSALLFRKAPYIDALFIPVLSGRNRLAAAKAIEAKSPAAIQLMPNLSRDMQRLRQAAHLARILAPEALQRLVASIQLYRASHGQA